MNQVNRGRIMIGGVVGGILIFLMMGLANHVFLNAAWMDWMSRYGAFLPHPPTRESMVLWLLQSLLVGITGTALYAGIRPRYGAGPRTALWAGFLVWVLVYLTEMLNGMALGHLSRSILAGECVSGLVSALVGVYAGAAIYKE
jgi:hypothetical protein